MANEVTTQIVQENPQIEAYRLGLLNNVQRFIAGQITGIDPETQQPVTRGMPPAFQIAGLSPMQQQAAQLTQQGLGTYQPYLQNALNLSQTGAEVARTSGLGGIQEAFGATRMGQQGLAQAMNLAQQQRAMPYQYQELARQELGRATNLGLGAANAMQAQAAAAQQQIAGGAQRAADVSRSAAERMLAQADFGQRGIAGAGQQAISSAQAAIPGLQSAAQRGYAEAMAGRGGLSDIATRAQQFGGLARSDLSQAVAQANQAISAGTAGLQGVARQFDPREQVGAYFNPFEQQVVQQALQDIRREGDISAQGLRAQAVGRGAFGGSRQAVAEQELQRNVLEQQARTAAQMRQAGFGQASQQAQQAFEAARQRQMAGAQAAAGLGLQGASMRQQAAQQAAQLGLAGTQQAAAAQQAAAGLGLQAAGLGAQTAQQQGQMGISAAGQNLAAQQAAAQLGTAATQQAAQLGLAGAQQQQAAGQQMGALGLQAGQAGLSAAQLGMGTAGQLAGLGTQFGQLSQADVNQMLNMAQQSGQFGQQLAGLGQAATGVGQQLGQFGMQQAQLGQVGQQMRGTDIQRLTALGGQEQALQQAVLDATRQSNLQQQQFPYQQYAFLSDIYRGTPSSQSTTTMTQTPDPSVAQQIAGLGIAGLGAAKGIQSLF